MEPEQRVIAALGDFADVVVKAVGVKGVSHDANFLCVPSQRGGDWVCLHWHQRMVVGSVHSNFTGCRPVPLWLPSQNGWWLEWPQEHHQWTPGSTSSVNGLLSQTRGSSAIQATWRGSGGKARNESIADHSKEESASLSESMATIGFSSSTGFTVLAASGFEPFPNCG
jgi:hypothetical protein